MVWRVPGNLSVVSFLIDFVLFLTFSQGADGVRGLKGTKGEKVSEAFILLSNCDAIYHQIALITYYLAQCIIGRRWLPWGQR